MRIKAGSNATMRLSIKIPLLVLVTIVVAMAVGASLIVTATADSVRSQAIESSRQSAAAYASAVSRFLDDAKSLLEGAQSDPRVSGLEWTGRPDPSGHGIRATDARGTRTVARALLGRSVLFEYVEVIDRRGQMFLAEPYALQATAQGGDKSSLEWYRRVVSTGLPVISNQYTSVLTGRPSVAVALPMRDRSGRLSGVWVGGLRLSVFSSVGRVHEATGASESFGFLTDRRGIVIAHHGRPDYVRARKDLSALTPVRRALSGQSGTGEWIGPEAGPTLGAYEPLPGWGWAVVYATSEDHALAPAGALRRQIILTTVIVALLTAGVAFVVSRRLVRPVNRLIAVAERIGAGDLSVRTDDTGPLEVRRLAHTFDSMAVALGDRDAALRANARRLEEMNIDLKVKNRDLDAKNAEVESFAYSVAHDLRTPLRSITAFGGILAADHAEGLDEKGRHYLERINIGGQTMTRVIDEILALSRVGRTAVRPTTCDVSALAAGILDGFRESEPEREVEVQIEPGLTVCADPGLLEVLLANVLDNAWKYTGPTTNAAIEVGAGPEAGTFYVRDNGVGFDMLYAENIFKPFRRLHSQADFAGTGIGLASAATIMAMHRGRIRAESEPGRGATFFIAFGADRELAPIITSTPSGALQPEEVS